MPARVPPGANGKPGKVVGTDIEEAKLKLARQEGETLQLSNVEFRLGDITRDQPEPEFALVHTRFILEHLRNPAAVLKNMRRTLRPGGIMAVEDIDFREYFCDPDSPSLWRHIELCTRGLANECRPACRNHGRGEAHSSITLENIARAVIAEGLATQAEIDQLVTELYQFARAPGAVCTMPRVVEAWGCQAGRAKSATP